MDRCDLQEQRRIERLDHADKRRRRRELTASRAEQADADYSDQLLDAAAAWEAYQDGQRDQVVMWLADSLAAEAADPATLGWQAEQDLHRLMGSGS